MTSESTPVAYTPSGDLAELIDSYRSKGIDALNNNISADIVTLFDAKFLYDARPLQWESLTATGGSAAKATNEPIIDMTVTGSTGSRVVRQGPYIPYQPGKICRVIMTGTMASTAPAGTTCRLVKRTYTSGSQVDSTIGTVTYADGTTIDWTKSQILAMDILWLGVDGADFYVKLADGLCLVGDSHNMNLTSGVYMRTATLPVRYEIEKTATGIRARMGFFDNHADKSTGVLGGDGLFFEIEYTTANGAVMRQICSTVQSVGGWNPRGVILSDKIIVTSPKPTGAAGAYTPLMSLRLGANYNRATINPLQIDLANITAGAGLFVHYEVRLYNDSTHLTAASFAAPVTGSAAEFDRAATAISAASYIVVGGGIISTQQRDEVTSFENTEKIISNIAGTSKCLTVVATSTGAAQNILGHFEWQEIT
jgi:hypothetical protein